jgi:hypothetical protein
MRTILTGRGAGLHDIDRAVAESGIAISRVLTPRASVVDDLVELWAAKRGIPVEVHRLDRTVHDVVGRWIQNQEMVERADAFIAVWDGTCRRTHDGLFRGRRHGLVVHEHRVAAIQPAALRAAGGRR